MPQESRVFLFGTIQMANRENISANSKINGVPISNIGNSENSQVNGACGFYALNTIALGNIGDRNLICNANTNNFAVSGGGGITTNNYVFLNTSGFKQPSNNSVQLFKDPNVTQYYVQDDFNANNLYPLTFSGDC